MFNTAFVSPGVYHEEDFGSPSGLDRLWAPLFSPVLFETAGTAVPASIPNSPDAVTPTVIDQAERSEKIWIVWSDAAVPELEAVKSLANPMDRGLISDGGQIKAVQDFLSGHTSTKPSEQKDEVKDQINLKVKERVLVHLLKMEPR